jgi:Protein of unknown function (DUF3102)
MTSTKKSINKAIKSKPAKALVCTRAQWVKRIRAAYDETVYAYLKLGRELLAAKKSLERGEFLEMIERDLPFTATTAQRLMKIAPTARLVKAAHCAALPLSWGTAYD